MGLSRTVFDINSNFSRKLQIFPTHVFNVPLMKFLLELYNDACAQKLEQWGYLAVQKVS